MKRWIKIIKVEGKEKVALFEKERHHHERMVDLLEGKIDIESVMNWKLGLEELEQNLFSNL